MLGCVDDLGTAGTSNELLTDRFEVPACPNAANEMVVTMQTTVKPARCRKMVPFFWCGFLLLIRRYIEGNDVIRERDPLRSR